MTRRSSSVTIRDVARQSGVSVATVSRYLNQNTPVSKDVSARIQQVMDALSYVPDAPARHLATRKTRTVGLLLLNMYRDFFAPLITGIEAVVAEKGYNLLVSTIRKSSAPNHPLPISSHNTDGLLVFANTLDDETILQLYKRKFPVVFIHRTAPKEAPFPCVTVENKAATRKIVEHLIDQHGCRRIIFMRGPEYQEDSCWREEGYRLALESRQIAVDESLILHGEFEHEVAYDSLDRFIKNNHIPFDAVFTGDDDAAIGVLEALKDNGKHVPGDVSVVGFDDLRLSAYLYPPLTTVRAPTEMVGRTAAEQLFCLMDGEVVEPTTLLPTEIILRCSCGCNNSIRPD